MEDTQNLTDEIVEDTQAKNESQLPVNRRSVLKSASVLGASGALLTDISESVEAHDVPDHAAETPPMGWNSWNTFRCNISEDLIQEMVDAIVDSGLRDAGYEYVVLDDCWMAHERDSNGNLTANPDRFPSGMAAMGDYIHDKNLKYGIYESAGTYTCAQQYDGYESPGSLNHEVNDAATFASWGVDYLKYDNCGEHLDIDPQTRFERMWNALDATDRDIVKSQCSWGTYDEWTWASDIGSNLWRTTQDITDDWGRIMDILDQQVGLAEYAKPGHWNDPDMLEVGNEGLSESESRAHFSLWCILAAPLIAGNDVREISDSTLEILTNEEVIAINQDPAGNQGYKIHGDGNTEIWEKPLSNGDLAVLLFNRGDTETRISVTAEELSLDVENESGYVVRDLWKKQETFTRGTITGSVPSHDVAMYRVRQGSPDEAPPLTSITTEYDTGFAVPGETQPFTTRFTNESSSTIKNVDVEVAPPDGWDVEANSSTTFNSVESGDTIIVTWSITPPSDADLSTYDFTVSVSYDWQDKTLTQKNSVGVTTAPDPPTNGTYLSDLQWIEATNGWGPVERDMSVGENGSGDGQTISIGGKSYEKGLGTNALSTISYYLGGNASEFIADIGVDDEVNGRGSVTFQVWGDGEILSESDVLTGSDGPVSLEIDVNSVNVLKLVVTDGGDGNSYDHADWAGARVVVPADGSKKPPAVGSSDAPPTDPDGDGLYEDVNGDGEVTDADGDLLFKHFEDPEIQNHPEAYDFNENGRLDLDDIVEWHKKRS